MKTSLFIKINKPDDYNKVDLRDYEKLIKKFIYLKCKSRPNIVFIIEKLSKYYMNLKKRYFWIIKRVICYLKGIIYQNFIYRQRSNKSFLIIPALYKLIGYGNSNLIRNMRFYFFLNRIVVL